MTDSLLIPEAVAEARAHAAVLKRDARPAGSPAPGQLEPLLASLEQRCREPFTLRRLGVGAWEARTWAGDAGFGTTAAAAVADLLAELQAAA